MMFKMPKELHLECSIHHKKIISLLPPLFMITVPREEERKGVWRGWSASLPSPNPRWTGRQGPRGCGTVSSHDGRSGEMSWKTRVCQHDGHQGPLLHVSLLILPPPLHVSVISLGQLKREAIL